MSEKISKTTTDNDSLHIRNSEGCKLGIVEASKEKRMQNVREDKQNDNRQ